MYGKGRGSISREDKHLIAALRAGADACLLKDGPARHLLEAISYVRDGGQYISPLLKGARLFTKANANAPGDPLATESPPETKVFSYLVMGKRAKDIAERLRFWRRRR